jgi:hypothetical protein
MGQSNFAAKISLSINYYYDIKQKTTISANGQAAKLVASVLSVRCPIKIRLTLVEITTILVISTSVYPILKTHHSSKTFATKIIVGQLQRMDFNNVNE